MARENGSNQKLNYLQQKAENWVSIFVLAGCVAITVLLVVMSVSAFDLGNRLKMTAGTSAVESY